MDEFDQNQTYEDFDSVLCFAQRVDLANMSVVRRFKKRIFTTIDVAKRKEDQPAIESEGMCSVN